MQVLFLDFLLHIAAMTCCQRTQLSQPGFILRPRIGCRCAVLQQLGHFSFRRQLVGIGELGVGRSRLPPEFRILPGSAGAGDNKLLGLDRRSLLDRYKRDKSGIATDLRGRSRAAGRGLTGTGNDPFCRDVCTCCADIRTSNWNSRRCGILQRGCLASHRQKRKQGNKRQADNRYHVHEYSGLHQMVVMTWTKKARIKEG
jgi:hypothetical protein